MRIRLFLLFSSGCNLNPINPLTFSQPPTLLFSPSSSSNNSLRDHFFVLLFNFTSRFNVSFCPHLFLHYAINLPWRHCQDAGMFFPVTANTSLTGYGPCSENTVSLLHQTHMTTQYAHTHPHRHTCTHTYSAGLYSSNRSTIIIHSKQSLNRPPHKDKHPCVDTDTHTPYIHICIHMSAYE